MSEWYRKTFLVICHSLHRKTSIYIYDIGLLHTVRVDVNGLYENSVLVVSSNTIFGRVRIFMFVIRKVSRNEKNDIPRGSNSVRQPDGLRHIFFCCTGTWYSTL